MAQVAEDKDFALLLYNQDLLEQAQNDQEFMNTLRQDSAARGGAASSSSGKQPIRTRYLGHVIGYQPIGDQNSLIRPVPSDYLQLCQI